VQDSAKFILSKSAALRQYNIAKKISDIVSFSFKTNPDVGKVLEENTDCFFCVHSPDSLELIKDKKRIWFFAQAWDEKEIEFLTRQNVSSFVVDNTEDLDALLAYMKKSGVKANLMLRIRLKENTIHTGKYFVFGMYSREINRLIPELRKIKNIGLLGVHFHRKTENISEWSLKEELSETLEKDTLEKIDILDIGGGLPVKYKNYNDFNPEKIFEKIKELREWLHGYNIKMIIEPGRFIAAPSANLEATIKNIYENNIIINCSVYNSAVDTIVANIKLIVENELENGDAYTIKGSTPCSMDIFRYRVFLDKPKKGDKITFLNAGAYTYSTDFCNLKKLRTITID